MGFHKKSSSVFSLVGVMNLTFGAVEDTYIIYYYIYRPVLQKLVEMEEIKL